MTEECGGIRLGDYEIREGNMAPSSIPMSL